ncbi:ornithine cyclodeaminase family protein [Roseivirga sp. E12]|uniref:ornithine cyclodeaminase family protein n=1 Tax=Roseivirga sp. E12 TaxID=2819237 RepID=UPI001ABC1140|nr:ornithine cyclodeaminase family protein [Roseivirga sp. E12]MBO3699409.1 ornithine cyclodeaminase family protein [Roseivirga sp. E12]
MRFVSGTEIASIFSYEEFIPILRKAFCENYTIPPRHHHEFDNGVGENTSTLLLMPAWSKGEYLGVKMVTVSPYNGEVNLPAIQGVYTLMDARNGLIKTQMDAKILTVKRTAAASALASSFLSRKDSSTLLMVGTGALAPELVKAHSTVRSIDKVLIWGRSIDKAHLLKNQLQHLNLEVEVIESLKEGVKQADIISVATLSQEPLILGEWLGKGQHLDLVGAYKADMREADDKVMERASIFIDHEGALSESGDLAIPLTLNVISKEDIKSDLFELCNGSKQGRVSDKEITLFKSVGHALEDLAAGLFVFGKLN